MQSIFGDGVEVVGIATKDAELRRVGNEGKYSVCTFDVAIGDKDNPKYANCKAWHKLAKYASGIKKGDCVRAVGTMEVREYEGKTYKTLNVAWLNFVGEVAKNDFIPINSDEELPFN